MKEKKRGSDCNTTWPVWDFVELCVGERKMGWELDILDEDNICQRGDDIKRGSNGC